MSSYPQRFVRALKLDPSLFEEVEADRRATPQALATVLISSVAAGLGGFVSGGLMGLGLQMAVALAGWAIWAFLCYFIGTRLLPEPQTRADFGELLRCTGFASAPGVVQILGVIPFLGAVAWLAAWVWMLCAFVVAVRQALDYVGTWRAVWVCVLAWVVMMALNGLILLLSMGRLAV